MAVTKDKKAEVLQGLIDEFKNATSVAVARTNGLSVTEVQDFRSKLRDNDVKFKVAKKTLICLAAKEAGYDVDKSELEGSIGLAFANDEVTAAKLVKAQDKKKQKMELIALFLDGKVLDSAGANELADVPSKDELLAKFVGMLQSPLNSFAGMLGSPLTGFARAVSEYAKIKPEEAASEAPKAEPKAEEAPKEEAAPAEEASEDAPAADATEETSEEASE